MAFITLHPGKLRANFNYLDDLFRKNNIEWAVVLKVFCGNRLFLETLIETLGLEQVCDSRVTNLKIIKQLAPDVETIFIKPPPKRMAARIVRYADISFNTEYETIRALSEAAAHAGRIHRIVLMVELGELREGIMPEDFADFYASVYQLPNIQVAGVGANLNCMYGILPDAEKLDLLDRCAKEVEQKYGTKLPIVSGGSSVTIPLLENGTLPGGINHFRVGESLLLGNDVYHSVPHPAMHQDVFRLFGEIIELSEKPNVPDGEQGKNLQGEEVTFDDPALPDRSFRAIVDLGLLDTDEKGIRPVADDITIAGVSSDMLVLNLGDNPHNLAVGQLVEFRMNYMGVLRIMNSDYVDKRVENGGERSLQREHSFKYHYV